MKIKVLLGFSGGIDSTASAMILAEEGYDVVLATLDTVGDSAMLEKAARSAGQLGLAWRAVDVRDLFRREVMDYFRDSYLRGETPVPCTHCNPAVKWGTLYETACAEGFDHIATGHYFRIRKEADKYYVRTAADPAKDQSYYLWALPQEYLRMALTPMGDRIKQEIKGRVRGIAAERESMGVCFLGGVNYTEYMRKALPEIAPGKIVNGAGECVGTHDGYPFYTIGQKRGLDVPHSCCVIAIDAEHNRLVVGDDTQLYYCNLLLRDCTVVDTQRLTRSETLTVKIRGFGRNPAGYARAEAKGGKLQVALDFPAWAPAKGQSVLLYEGDLVLGGGYVENYW